MIERQPVEKSNERFARADQADQLDQNLSRSQNKAGIFLGRKASKRFAQAVLQTLP
jgi:hypothetical protein